MADLDRTLLAHYNLKTLYPDTWPEDKDFSSDDDEAPVKPQAAKHPARRSKSRYSVLDRSGSNRVSVPGAERSKDGVENLVQRDEPDPLGAAPSVVQILKQRGLAVEDDPKLRNRFLLSSTSFSPTLFLSQVHNTASTESLLQGLDFLSRSIEKKSASLKVLVESNFERFVKAKATIDNVYEEMRTQGRDNDPPSPRRPHSRHTSKSGHLRQVSNVSTSGFSQTSSTDKKKNALTKESEYGVAGIKTPLAEVAVKAEEVWGPALGGQEKEGTLRAVLSTIEKHRDVFELGSSIRDCIRRKDNEMLVEEYKKARKFAEEARKMAESRGQKSLSDSEIHQIVVAARMWSDIDEQMASFKRDVWKRLSGTHSSRQPGDTEEDRPDEYMELISVLLELGVEENPIWVWLLSRFDYLKNKITRTTERSTVEIEILRRKLGNSAKPSLQQMASYLRSAGSLDKPGTTIKIDSVKVLEFWDYVYSVMNDLLSPHGGVLGEIIEYWDIVQSFIDGKAQRKLPLGPNGSSQKYHLLSSDGIRQLQKGTQEIIGILRQHVTTFFSEPPIDDVSMLFSPIPTTPNTPFSAPPSALSPTSALSPRSGTRFKFDPSDIPPPSPRNGESWEQFAFWPPHANAPGGVYYLSKILVLVGTAASEIAGLSLMRGRSSDELKLLIGAVREHSVRAICAAWNNDSENCRMLEDWTRSPDRRDLTNMPNRFMALESVILGNLQKITYITEAANKSDSPDVVVPPPAKLLQQIRQQFTASLYKALSGMVENAENLRKNDALVNGDGDSIVIPSRGTSDAGLSISNIDATNRNIRMLLTLSNLQSLRNDVVPQLIAQFESNFSVKLSDESKQIRDVVEQIDSRLFSAYTKPISENLSRIIEDGIGSPDWAPPTTQHLKDAKPYVYDVLLALVIVHTDVSTTASTLVGQILKYLLEQISLSLIESFKKRPKYSLAALMQATLDIELMAQTLGNYTTSKASETQSAIYVVLDERTDNEARRRLQDELPELRAILKRLKEGTKGEFACFRRQRQHRASERPSSERS
ncbi:hypothetical protein EJ05DRAFT_497095 [Pseudovirgaria hyperparasitica]|uniref:Exocyst complex component SEC5 n=1 Tax=Pseudovirgaria hyperparasitica TaxID=470096 RepID=A0A6A6WJ61_9PEZI|nr:uncharacterized protein EJ05DRAFT_497095 [Pseudovirgaria hyperparasitica]KAF2762235.1 hypothetical protein EJ05DRAFT_497095 [Pseudovirgaria hyperparasitica]